MPDDLLDVAGPLRHLLTREGRGVAHYSCWIEVSHC